MNGNTRKPVNRTTAEIKLRPSHADNDDIRAAAETAGESLTEYLVGCHKSRRKRVPTQVEWDDGKAFDTLSEIDRHLANIPGAVRKLDADLGRMYGNLKDLFAYSPAVAMQHQSEINAALRAVRDLRAEIMPVLAEMQVESAGPREQVATVLAAIGRTRSA